MSPARVDAIGMQTARLVKAGQIEPAYICLQPVLLAKTPFPRLERIAAPVGAGPIAPANRLLARIAQDKPLGGWVIIGIVLRQQLGRDLEGALGRCRRYIISASTWYGADILGERVVGGALLLQGGPSLVRLRRWREDSSPWVRRALGSGIHFWAKRSRGIPAARPQAQALLDFLAPLFAEPDNDAVKGIGWGLKTLGRCFPDQTVAWLDQRAMDPGPKPRALMLRKARTYLPASGVPRRTRRR
jgi:DNA alkylation repair enzyme